jgi:glycosyltransferase involved in cell wall biosynthesis
MRILHVIDTLSPASGGPPEAVRQLVLAYEREVARASIEVVCLDRPDAPFLSEMACPVHALGQSILGRFAFSPRLWRWLHCHAGRFDIIVMNGIWSFPDIAVRSAARNAGVPYGVFVHGALDPWFNRKYPFKRLKKWLYWPIQYTALRDAAAVFFTTDIERDLAKDSFRPNKWNSVVVPYGIVDLGDTAEDAARQIDKFQAIVPALRGRSFLLFMGRIHEKKGCDLLLQAFGRVAAVNPDLDLVIAGSSRDGLQSKLQAQAVRFGIASRVHWPGMIRGDLKWGALRACQAFVLPSHQENFGISVVEALCAGRPVLISNQVNIWPDVKTDGVGLVDDDTLAGTERLLQRWFQLGSIEREEMARRARPCFLARYTMNKTASLIYELFAPENDRRRSGRLAG